MRTKLKERMCDSPEAPSSPKSPTPEEPPGQPAAYSIPKKRMGSRMKAAALVSNILKRSDEHKEEKRRNNMLKALNMALACYSGEALCALTFYEVQDILFTAGFSSDHIKDNEAFLRQAILVLLTDPEDACP